MKKSRKWSLAGAGVVVLVGGIWGYTTLDGAASELDSSRVATIERGTMTKSVVATGKIEPITKVEIKSKANGIIERLIIDVDQVVAPGQVLAELDKENLTARCARRAPTCRRPRPRSKRPEAQLQKNESRPRRPTSSSRSATMRAPSSCLPQQAGLAVGARRRQERRRAGGEPAASAARCSLVIAQAQVAEATANVAQAQAAVERAEEELANATIRAPIRAHRADARRRDRQPGVVDPEHGRERHARHDAGRHRPGVRARQGGRSGHRPRPARPAGPHHRRDVPGQDIRGQVTQISPIGVEKDNVTTFEVEVSIDNPGKELKANMTANAEIVLEEFPNSLLVPEAAIIYDAQRNAVRRGRRSGDRGTAGAGADQGRRRQRHENPGARRPEGRATRSLLPDRLPRPQSTIRLKHRMREASSSPEPARQQAAQLPDDVRDPVGRDLGRRAVGDGRGIPARQPARARGARPERRASSGAAARRCRPAANAPAAASCSRSTTRARCARESRLDRASSARRFSAAASRSRARYNAAALTVHGIEPQYQEIRTIDIERGRAFRTSTTRTGRTASRSSAPTRRSSCSARRDSIGQTVIAQRHAVHRRSARSGRRIRTATTAVPTTTRSSCRSRRWRATSRDRTPPPGAVSQIILAPQPWVIDAAAAACSTSGTGRIEDIDWPLEREIRAHRSARAHGFDPDGPRTPSRCGTRRCSR